MFLRYYMIQLHVKASGIYLMKQGTHPLWRNTTYNNYRIPMHDVASNCKFNMDPDSINRVQGSENSWKIIKRYTSLQTLPFTLIGCSNKSATSLKRTAQHPLQKTHLKQKAEETKYPVNNHKSSQRWWYRNPNKLWKSPEHVITTTYLPQRSNRFRSTR